MRCAWDLNSILRDLGFQKRGGKDFIYWEGSDHFFIIRVKNYSWEDSSPLNIVSKWGAREELRIPKYLDILEFFNFKIVIFVFSSLFPPPHLWSFLLFGAFCYPLNIYLTCWFCLFCLLLSSLLFQVLCSLDYIILFFSSLASFWVHFIPSKLCLM